MIDTKIFFFTSIRKEWEISNYLKSLGYKKIVAHFYEGNEKSKRVCEKLGFKFQKKELDYFKPGDKYINDYEYILYL